MGEGKLAAEDVKQNEIKEPPEMKAENNFRADGASSVDDDLLDKSKEDDEDDEDDEHDDLGVSSKFGAGLDDSEIREFVRDPAVHSTSRVRRPWGSIGK